MEANFDAEAHSKATVDGVEMETTAKIEAEAHGEAKAEVSKTDVDAIAEAGASATTEITSGVSGEIDFDQCENEIVVKNETTATAEADAEAECSVGLHGLEGKAGAHAGISAGVENNTQQWERQVMKLLVKSEQGFHLGRKLELKLAEGQQSKMVI